MPRASAAYLIGDRTVLKGGYGLYYDTLNASDYVAAQAGYSVTTTSTISDDLGRTFKWATPATGAASFDPFPVRADGTRWDPVVGDTLGVNSLLGGALTTENGLRDHARQQRWRVSLQRQLSVEPRRRSGLRRRLQRQASGDHPPGLPAGAVLGREQHAEHGGQHLPHGAGAEPVLHQQFRVSADHRPGRSISAWRPIPPSRRRRFSATACCVRLAT